MNKRILVIDDRQELLALLRMLLEDADYGVSVLDNGELVEETVQKNQPDLIILDIRLGAVSGLDVLERLRSAQATASIPVIVATAALTDAAVVERLTRDPSGRYANISVLKKPFDGDALLRRIQRMVSVTEVG